MAINNSDDGRRSNRGRDSRIQTRSRNGDTYKSKTNISYKNRNEWTKMSRVFSIKRRRCWVGMRRN